LEVLTRDQQAEWISIDHLQVKRNPGETKINYDTNLHILTGMTKINTNGQRTIAYADVLFTFFQ